MRRFEFKASFEQGFRTVLIVPTSVLFPSEGVSRPTVLKDINPIGSQDDCLIQFSHGIIGVTEFEKISSSFQMPLKHFTQTDPIVLREATLESNGFQFILGQLSLRIFQFDLQGPVEKGLKFFRALIIACHRRSGYGTMPG